MDNQPQSLEPTDELHKRIFYVYVVLLVGWFVYFTVKYMANFDNFSEDQLIEESNYFLPPLIGPFVGLITAVVSSAKASIIAAIIAAALTYILLPFFYELFWQLL